MRWTWCSRTRRLSGFLPPSPGNPDSRRQAARHCDLSRHKLHGNYQGQVGNNLNTRIQGTRHPAPHGTKRHQDVRQVSAAFCGIEVTVNDVAFFQQRAAKSCTATASERSSGLPMQKPSSCSLPALRELLQARFAQRYLKFLSDIETPEIGVQRLNQLTQTQSKTSAVTGLQSPR